MQTNVLGSTACFLALSLAAGCTSGVHHDNATAQKDYSSANVSDQKSPDSRNAHFQTAGVGPVTYGNNPERFVTLPTYQPPFNIKDPKTADEHFDVAVDADNRKDFATAIRQYQSALGEQPGWAIAHFRLAEDLRKEGRLDEAIAHLNQAIGFSPQLYAAYEQLARAYESKGDLEKAIGTYSRLLALSPKQIAVLYQEGIWYRRLGNRNQARKKFEQYRALAATNDTERNSARYQGVLEELQAMK